MFSIRKATIFDLLGLSVLGQTYMDEVNNHIANHYCPKHCMKIAKLAILDDKQDILVLTKDDKYIGFLWVSITTFVWSPSKIAQDLIFFILPEHRGKKMGVAMIKEYEHWAKEKGAKTCLLSVASDIHAKQTSDLYQSLDYFKYGRVHRKQLE